MAVSGRRSTVVFGPNFEEAVRRLGEETHAVAIAVIGYFAWGVSPRAENFDLLVIVPEPDEKSAYALVAGTWHPIREELGTITYDLLVVHSPRSFVENLTPGSAAWYAARHGAVLYGELPDEGLKVRDA